MTFSRQLVGLFMFPRNSLKYYFFQCLVSMFEPRSLCCFKAKMIRVLFQLESPNSEHRHSSYVQNNSYYSMIKTEIRIWVAHGPTLSEYFSNLEQELDNVYFYMDGSF